MQTYRSLYEHELAKLIIKQIEEAKNTLAMGFVPDYPAYRELTGIVKGLNMALEEMQEADRLCQGGEKET